MAEYKTTKYLDGKISDGNFADVRDGEWHSYSELRCAIDEIKPSKMLRLLMHLMFVPPIRWYVIGGWSFMFECLKLKRGNWDGYRATPLYVLNLTDKQIEDAWNDWKNGT